MLTCLLFYSCIAENITINHKLLLKRQWVQSISAYNLWLVLINCCLEGSEENIVTSILLYLKNKNVSRDLDCKFDFL